MEAILIKTGTLNSNGRVYSEEALEKAMKDFIKEFKEKHAIYNGNNVH